MKKEEENQKILELYNLGWSGEKISKYFGKTPNFARYRLKKMGISLRNQAFYTKQRFRITKKMEQEILDYFNTTKSIQKTFRKFHCDSSRIKKILLKNNIEIKNYNYKTINKDKLIKYYIEQNHSVKQCAEYFGCSDSAIFRKLKKFHINKQIIKPDQQEIIRLYTQELMNIPDICKKIKTSRFIVQNVLKNNNITRRSHSDTIKIAKGTYEITDEKLIDLYENQKWTLEGISKYFNKSPSFTIQRFRLMGYTTRLDNTILRIDAIDKDIIDDIAQEYKNGKSCKKIMIKHKMSFVLLKKILLKNGIKMRDRDTITDLFYSKITRHEHKNICDRYIKNKKESCVDIAKYYNVTPETIQNILKKNGIQPENRGQRLKQYKGGITTLHDMVRTNAKYIEWRDEVFNKNNYKSTISQNGGNLNCHHFIPFSKILDSVVRKNMPLLDYDEYYRYAICNDPRFYDLENGLCLTKNEHDLIEQTPRDGHPWWRIWRVFPEFALSQFNFTKGQYLSFNENGQIDPVGLSIVQSDRQKIKGIIRYEHYLGTIPNASIILCSETNGIITGIAVFGRGANKHTPKTTLELTRLCVPYYVIKPFGCRFLQACCQYIKNNCPDINNIISFADPNVGHNGGIYRMSGWQKMGHGKNDYLYFDPINSCIRHKSACRRIKGIDKTENELAQERGWSKIPLLPKYKYSISCV